MRLRRILKNENSGIGVDCGESTPQGSFKGEHMGSPLQPDDYL